MTICDYFMYMYIIYILRHSYTNFMVTANQKSIIKMRIGQRDETLACEEMSKRSSLIKIKLCKSWKNI